MILALILIPGLAGLLSFISRSSRVQYGLLLAAAIMHVGLTASAWFKLPAPIGQNWFFLDDVGLLFLSIISLLFLAAALYGVDYLRRIDHGHSRSREQGLIFRNTPQATLVASLLFFLAAMTLVTVSQHFGILWVAIEATTLTSAPMIYFHRNARSLEATWKYLLICSVGIALALMGNILLAVATLAPNGESAPLFITQIGQLAAQEHLHLPWLKAAFLFLLVGYGTKMGLAPLHTWLPDAHSEAPALVSALLSGALLNCAFLGLLRIHQVCVVAGLGVFSGDLLIFFGLLSLLFAAVFILGQTDYKRLLAYSSVEHMGLLALGVGLGGRAVFGSMLHALNHSLTKAMLFFVAGNILGYYRTRIAADVQGVLRVMPLSGALWIAGLLAITGFPPFGLFISEFIIFKEALDQGRYLIAAIGLSLLGLIFVSMSAIILRMAQGSPAAGVQIQRRPESLLAVGPPALFCLLTIVLGLYIPQRLEELLTRIAVFLGGG